MTSRWPSAMLALLLGSPCVHADDAAPLSFQAEGPITVLSGGNKTYYSQARAAVVPDPWRVVMTTQETDVVGTHGYRDLFRIETADGQAWTAPQPVPTLARRPTASGDGETVIGDCYPKWHAQTGTVLVTGKTFTYLGGETEDRSREQVAYAVLQPQTGEWSDLQILALPETDHAGKKIVAPNAGCVQRVDLPGGDVLLPIRYHKDSPNAPYTTTVARCAFDGKTLTYKEHGTELSSVRLYEPSLAAFQGRYFLTMRADNAGYVSRSSDGLNYTPPAEWKFDDGTPLGSYNTQQHWAAHSDGLYLVYTRRGADNDKIFRNRAPLFIARVDPERLCVIRETEQVLFPQNCADLGNFGVTDVSPDETWVVASEMIMTPPRNKDARHVLLVKLRWSRPNANFPLN